MTKTWLMRRPLRKPPSRPTTAAINSSVCRLPFIRSSALPSRTSSTAFAAAAWLCSTSTIWKLPRSIPAELATAAIFAAGPTRIGDISPVPAASTAPDNAVASQGCATAVGIGSELAHLSSNSSYFPVPGCGFISHLLIEFAFEVVGLARRLTYSQERVEIVENAGGNQYGTGAQEQQEGCRMVPQQAYQLHHKADCYQQP